MISDFLKVVLRFNSQSSLETIVKFQITIAKHNILIQV